MSRAIEIPVGTRFGRLVTTSLPYPTGHGRFVDCRCDCTAVVATAAYRLLSGKTQSCGCLWRERITKHGLTGTIEYQAWSSMWTRCTNPLPRYGYYVGRIKVCDRWKSFENFLADMGPKPAGKYRSGRALYSIERLDNDGDYEPGNCRWATMLDQNLNKRHCPTCTCH